MNAMLLFLLGMEPQAPLMKLTPDMLKDNQNEYRSLFDDSPIPLWIEDFSEVKKYLDDLHREGIGDLKTYFENRPEVISYCANLVKVVDVNRATLDLYNAKSKKEFKDNLNRIFCRESYGVFKEELIALAEGKTVFESETINQTLTGEKINLSFKWFVATGYEKTLSKVFISIIDITKHKRTEEVLRESEQRKKAFFQAIPDLVFILTKEGDYVEFNAERDEDLAIPRNEIIGKNIRDAGFSQDYVNSILYYIQQAIQTKQVQIFEYQLKTPKGLGIWEARLVALNENEILAIVRDITKHKEIEKELHILNTEIVKSNIRLKQLSLQDSHTGLYNYRYLGEIIEAEFYRAKRNATPLSAIMLDIDYFKSINDVYGHQFGDLVLKQLSRQLKKIVRQYDIVIRFGGEEFVIISPGTDRATALVLAQRILDAINLYNFGDKQHTTKLKLSIAIASYPEDKITRGMDL
ncbi:MAG: sensor domain-containing diguanylate cyclase, partial [Candidatus Omnitrophica bacterium]|nr:sensor domain-containing diguanylate cyclase [Candidatus Omnitrophota bacterium]